MDVYVYSYMRTSIGLYAFINIKIQNIRKALYVFLYMYINMYIYIHVCRYTYKYRCAHVDIHIYISNANLHMPLYSHITLSLSLSIHGFKYVGCTYDSIIGALNAHMIESYTHPTYLNPCIERDRVYVHSPVYLCK